MNSWSCQCKFQLNEMWVLMTIFFNCTVTYHRHSCTSEHSARNFIWKVELTCRIMNLNKGNKHAWYMWTTLTIYIFTTKNFLIEQPPIIRAMPQYISLWWLYNKNENKSFSLSTDQLSFNHVKFPSPSSIENNKVYLTSHFE